MRACRPPWFSMSLSTIHDVAEPLAMKTISRRRAAHPFQKFSNAGVKSERKESIQGISSTKIIFLRSSGKDDRYSSKTSKASNQSDNLRADVSPMACFNALAKLRNWVRWGRLCPPTKVKSYFRPKNSSTR